MDYFAGLDISMDETHVCVLNREDVVVRESKTESTGGLSQMSWRKRQLVFALCSRPDAWHRSFFTD
jgi:hypothetical protein